MKIKKIRVENLFGNLNHTIPLSDEGITFIHGPNGCGKTTLLRLVQDFLAGEFKSLKTTDFTALEIHYDDDHKLRVDRVCDANIQRSLIDDDIARDVGKISISLVSPDGTSEHRFDYSKQIKELIKNERSFSMSSIDRRLPFLNRVGPREWVDQRTGSMLSLAEVMELYGDHFGESQLFKQPSWLIERLKQSRCGFVKTQRLIHMQGGGNARSYRNDEPTGTRDVVEIYSDRIKDTIANKLAESAVLSQARDRSFPTRLLHKQFPMEVPQPQLLDLYRSTEQRAQNLMAAGLLDQAESIPLPKKRFTKAERDVLALYLSDFNEKLDAFTDLQKRIEALIDIVGTKLRRKKFTVNRLKGFVFETTEGGRHSLSAKELSSGEQHQLVLFYELIFSSSGVNLFLIDEPEISLHVEWQRRFLDDLRKVQKLTGANFLIATHSPQIINNRRDIAVPLDGGCVDANEY